jgi:hypothetical protein
MKKYYWMGIPTPSTLERHNKIIQILGDGIKTVRNITYKMYPHLKGTLLDNAYKTTIKDLVRLRVTGQIRFNQIKEVRTKLNNTRGYHDVKEFKNTKESQNPSDLYKRNRRPAHTQTIEVWFEKETVIDDFETVCGEYDIPTLTTRGDPQWSTIKKASDRLTEDHLILYFGDNDKRGRQIYQEIQDFIEYLSMERWFQWCGLTYEQEERFGLPPNSRIDGLNTNDLRTIIKETILLYIDKDILADIEKQEEKDKEYLDNYEIKLIKKR